MKQSEVMVKDEQTKTSSLDARASLFQQDSDLFVLPDNDGVYNLREVDCRNDYIAIVPLMPKSATDTGIVIPNSDTTPTMGIVIGKDAKYDNLPFGAIVKFGGVTPIDLTDTFDFYGSKIVVAIRYQNIYCVIGNAEINKM